MKKISLDDAKKYLSTEEIEKILGNKILHQSTEDLLENLNNNERWTSDREIYISSIYRHFSNINWVYYRKCFQDLKPKKLTIKSGNISCISSIENITTLEVLEIGDNYNLKLEENTAQEMLLTCLKLPNLKQVKFFVSSKGGGSAADHKDYIDRICTFIAKNNKEISITSEYSLIDIKILTEKAIA
jgi:hypothetical protein